ncbi:MULTISPECIES: hypothetical protein [Cytobacillus]|uniref:Uncharacterized protein n=2 Tax=Bacillati TaxID=1783272 RepID=A0A2N0ZIF1_9BACI|nr:MULTISPECIES: hypothetical protein [Cytobacillus]MDK7667420.1 hypothetical protein [Cytobacillus oceanisediminis]MEC1157724.1 hypothetical protein [Cytobacillus horneckiae]PKG29292.1 hypothetical protein CWS20_09360 [Cytobacillus horneckiae]
MPNMNQKLKDYFLERLPFVSEENLIVLTNLYKLGPENMAHIAEKSGVKQHRINPIISTHEALGFVELYNAGQAKEYVITDFGIEYLTLIGRLPEKNNPELDEIKEDRATYETPTVSVSGEQVSLLEHIFRLLNLKKINTIPTIAEQTEQDEKVIKEILLHLDLSGMVKNQFKQGVRRYELTELGENYYQFLRGKELASGTQELLKQLVPRLFDTLLALQEGQSSYSDEVNYAKTLGLTDGSVLTDQGKRFVEAFR